jgi:hypothetical protein
LGFRDFLRPIHSLLGAVMGALSDLIPVLINLDVGALRLQFLYAFETAFMDDWEVMVE